MSSKHSKTKQDEALSALDVDRCGMPHSASFKSSTRRMLFASQLFGSRSPVMELWLEGHESDVPYAGSQCSC